jgi:hypothetical protein
VCSEGVTRSFTDLSTFASLLLHGCQAERAGLGEPDAIAANLWVNLNFRVRQKNPLFERFLTDRLSVHRSQVELEGCPHADESLQGTAAVYCAPGVVSSMA